MIKHKLLVYIFKVLLNFKEQSKDVEKHLDLPASWVNQVVITPKGKNYVTYTILGIIKYKNFF